MHQDQGEKKKGHKRLEGPLVGGMKVNQTMAANDDQLVCFEQKTALISF